MLTTIKHLQLVLFLLFFVVKCALQQSLACGGTTVAAMIEPARPSPANIKYKYIPLQISCPTSTFVTSLSPP
ncbi:hypothetical protein L596_024547 [Steinernema carpocapsae]|uniref:Secreted protein n=1 Tax=Steinernema carpocapsae TaxID=34508 RepID=A0A4U5MI85_STECR|nr:hypothetical protein L596_024547 [Steinernema carpocapsae]